MSGDRVAESVTLSLSENTYGTSRMWITIFVIGVQTVIRSFQVVAISACSLSAFRCSSLPYLSYLTKMMLRRGCMSMAAVRWHHMSKDPVYSSLGREGPVGSAPRDFDLMKRAAARMPSMMPLAAHPRLDGAKRVTARMPYMMPLETTARVASALYGRCRAGCSAYHG